jgi:hypothetical protein
MGMGIRSRVSNCIGKTQQLSMELADRDFRDLLRTVASFVEGGGVGVRL